MDARLNDERLTMPLVRWPYAQGRGWTLWHIHDASFHDTKGRTACGKRYPRAKAEKPQQDIGDEPVCQSCIDAFMGIRPAGMGEQTWEGGAGDTDG